MSPKVSSRRAFRALDRLSDHLDFHYIFYFVFRRNIYTKYMYTCKVRWHHARGVPVHLVSTLARLYIHAILRESHEVQIFYFSFLSFSLSSALSLSLPSLCPSLCPSFSLSLFLSFGFCDSLGGSWPFGWGIFSSAQLSAWRKRSGDTSCARLKRKTNEERL